MSAPVVDGLQINNWDREILLECRAGGIDAVNATCAVWEDAAGTRAEIDRLRALVGANADIATIVERTADIDAAQASGRVGLILGFQNGSPFEDRLELVEEFHGHGVRVAQLTYNARNLIGGACYDAVDEGLTPYGHEVIAAMNRVGMLVDLSHVGDRTSREAIDASALPVAITHANPRSFVDVPRNKPDDVIRAATARGGMIGVCLYPVVAGGADARLEDFIGMLLGLIEDVGIDHVGIGTDCTRGWGRDYLLYLRAGRREPLPGEDLPAWPAWPAWFAGPADFPVLGEGLAARGLDDGEIAKVLGGNWRRLLGEVIG